MTSILKDHHNSLLMIKERGQMFLNDPIQLHEILEAKTGTLDQQSYSYNMCMGYIIILSIFVSGTSFKYALRSIKIYAL